MFSSLVLIGGCCRTRTYDVSLYGVTARCPRRWTSNNHCLAPVVGFEPTVALQRLINSQVGLPIPLHTELHLAGNSGLEPPICGLTVRDPRPVRSLPIIRRPFYIWA